MSKSLYRFQKWTKKAWVAVWKELDESGFGKYIREFWGLSTALLTGKTGERGKGINYLQFMFLAMVVMAGLTVLRGGMPPELLCLALPMAFWVFPIFRKPIVMGLKLILQIREDQGSVWEAEKPPSTPQASEAVYYRRKGWEAILSNFLGELLAAGVSLFIDRWAKKNGK